MARRMLVGTILSCLLLLGSGAVAAEDQTPVRYGLFAASADGTVETFDLTSVLVPADRVCNGGSCSASSTQTLNCPTSGGPTCTGDQLCACVCSSDSPPVAANRCGEEQNDDTPGDDTPDPDQGEGQEQGQG
ncbi:MAG TPA: hypothetical protein VEG34_10490 [Thermoanaerobaculia bacterium]|nr:hypothetical protein [Thermoanaerobaculia bacterium]